MFKNTDANINIAIGSIVLALAAGCSSKSGKLEEGIATFLLAESAGTAWNLARNLSPQPNLFVCTSALFGSYAFYKMVNFNDRHFDTNKAFNKAWDKKDVTGLVALSSLPVAMGISAGALVCFGSFSAKALFQAAYSVAQYARS